VNRAALEHLLRAAAAVTGESTFYVVGSAAILPAWPPERDIPEVVARSREADLIPASGSLQMVDLIDGALGQDSTFDSTFGYYADGVDFSTVSWAPEGWRDRVIRFETAATGDAVGLCMEPHDLVVAKLCAGREKDLEFAKGLVQSGLVGREILLQRLQTVAAPEPIVQIAKERLTSMTDSRQ
jgi:hypothetical protein